jgi:multiple sugar transport system permease protein
MTRVASGADPSVAVRARVPVARRTRRRLQTGLRYAVIVFVTIVILFPIYWMVLSTFQPQQDTLTFPPPLFFKGFDTSAITSLFSEYPIGTWLAHSVLVGVVTLAITVALAIPGGYALSRLRWRGIGVFGFLLLFTQMMPGAMVVVPVLQFYRSLHWTNNLFALGVLYAAFNVPLGCWILKTSFDAVPDEIIEAARVDGAGTFRIITQILVALSRPGLAAVMVVAFFGSWNDYIFASTLLTDRSLYTAGLGIATFIGSTNIALYQLEAGGLIFSVLPVVLYLSVQRHVVRGLTAGAVK